MKTSPNFTLNQLLKALKHYALIILLVTIFFTSGAFAIAKYLVTPIYEATGYVMIANTQVDNTAQETYKQFLKTPAVLQQATINLNETQSQAVSTDYLREHIDVGSNQNSRITEISAQSPSRTTAQAMVNHLIDASRNKIDQSYHLGHLKIINHASGVSKPIFPNPYLFAVFGLVIGLFISTGFALWRSYGQLLAYVEVQK